MSNNTYQHVSNESVYVKFDPTNSNFEAGITDVQTALSSLSAIAVNGVGQASETSSGIIRLATEQEVLDGIDATSAVTPATLNVRLQHPEATETVLGLTQYATNEEAIAGVLNNRSIVASSLKATIDNVFETRTSNENANGVIRIATEVAAIAGVDDTTAMTPLKTKKAIAAATDLIPTYGPASESALGVVYIATPAQAQAGQLKDGYAISPSTFVNSKATNDKWGVTRYATVAEAAGNSNELAITPAGLSARTGNTGRTGIVKLTNTVGQGDSSTALSAAANVIATTGGNMVGRLQLNGVDYVTRNEIGSVPVGFISMNASNWEGWESGAQWARCDGRWLNRYEFDVLFSRIGYTYGGSGDSFALPNFNDIFPRGASSGRPIGHRQGHATQRMTGRFCADLAALGTIGRYVEGVFADDGWAGTPADTGSTWNQEVRIISFDNARQVPTDTETRPANMATWFMIRIK